MFFPEISGPHIKWFLKELKPEVLHKLLTAWNDKSAYAMCILGYTEGNSLSLMKNPNSEARKMSKMAIF